MASCRDAVRGVDGAGSLFICENKEQLLAFRDRGVEIKRTISYPFDDIYTLQLRCRPRVSAVSCRAAESFAGNRHGLSQTLTRTLTLTTNPNPDPDPNPTLTR